MGRCPSPLCSLTVVAPPPRRRPRDLRPGQHRVERPRLGGRRPLRDQSLADEVGVVGHQALVHARDPVALPVGELLELRPLVPSREVEPHPGERLGLDVGQLARVIVEQLAQQLEVVGALGHGSNSRSLPTSGSDVCPCNNSPAGLLFVWLRGMACVSMPTTRHRNPDPTLRTYRPHSRSAGSASMTTIAPRPLIENGPSTTFIVMIATAGSCTESPARAALISTSPR